MILFSTGRGSVVGSAISPVIKVCSNPETYRRMKGDMDVDAGRIVEGRATLDEVGREIVASIEAVMAGAPTLSEELGHQEFVLGLQDLRRRSARPASRAELGAGPVMRADPRGQLLLADLARGKPASRPSPIAALASRPKPVQAEKQSSAESHTLVAVEKRVVLGDAEGIGGRQRAASGSP